MTPVRAKLRWLKTLGIYRFLTLPRRAHTALRYVAPDVGRVATWLVTSREDTNFTYELLDRNAAYLASFVSVITRQPLESVRQVFAELQEDEDLRRHIRDGIEQSPFRAITDVSARYARRVGWYAFVRLLKPGIVVETGVDKGLGALVICAALRRNEAEGAAGRYYGTDINPTAGWLLTPPYLSYGEILVGDSIESLRKFSHKIDLFINDSDHSDAYEAKEYEIIADKLSDRAIILGDNSHETSILFDFATRSGWSFLFFKEEPKNHWYPGAGIGVAFRPETALPGDPSGAVVHELAD